MSAPIGGGWALRTVIGDRKSITLTIQGASWEEAKLPSYQGFKMINGAPAKLMEIWSMQQGGADNERLWLGTEPGGLFSSTDGGVSFELNEPLWYHSSRQKEGKWFGAGSDFPFIHSIEVNPYNSSHLYVAISCAGIFESLDKGASWQPKNKGLLAAYLPNPKVEVGQDPHQLLINPVSLMYFGSKIIVVFILPKMEENCGPKFF